MTLAAVSSSTAGPLGLLVVLLIGLALVLLVRNMNTRLRRLPKSFDPPEPPAAQGRDAEREPPA